jgi:hypothetical protein
MVLARVRILDEHNCRKLSLANRLEGCTFGFSCFIFGPIPQIPDYPHASGVVVAKIIAI